MLTATEIKAKAIAAALASNPSTWGKDQAAQALTVVSKLVKAGKARDEEADQVRAELGNHSAMRQKLEKHSMLNVQDDAFITALKAEIAKNDAELDELSKK